MALKDLMGECLIKNDGSTMSTTELSTEKGAIIALYFCAHWCPPCRTFNNLLKATYNDLTRRGQNFEVVFVSSDESYEKFKCFHADMPWLAIPYDNEAKKDSCSERFKVEGLPTLALVEASTGKTISSDARAAVELFGADGFPFTAPKLEECRNEIMAKKQSALLRMGALSFLGPLTTIHSKKSDIDFGSFAWESETIALIFVKGFACTNSLLVLNKLVEVQNTVGENRLRIVIIPLVEKDEFGDELANIIEDIPMVKPGKKARNVVYKFKELSQNIIPPYVLVITPNENFNFTIIADDVAKEIFFTGAAGFPWDVESLKALEVREEEEKENFKQKQNNLDFLSYDEHQSYVIDTSGDEIPLDYLRSKDVVGLYFSAQWCCKCSKLTPWLQKMYKACQEQEKSFEIVFISHDTDRDEYEKHFTEMPWLSLLYSERSLKTSLSELYGIQGIPNLVLLTGKGELITTDGLQAVCHGVEYFPWTDEVMAERQKYIQFEDSYYPCRTKIDYSPFKAHICPLKT